jgi:hypothetical protein
MQKFITKDQNEKGDQLWGLTIEFDKGEIA